MKRTTLYGSRYKLSLGTSTQSWFLCCTRRACITWGGQQTASKTHVCCCCRTAPPKMVFLPLCGNHFFVLSRFLFLLLLPFAWNRRSLLWFYFHVLKRVGEFEKWKKHSLYLVGSAIQEIYENRIRMVMASKILCLISPTIFSYTPPIWILSTLKVTTKS